MKPLKTCSVVQLGLLSLLAAVSGCGNASQADISDLAYAGLEASIALEQNTLPRVQISELSAYAGKRASLFAVSGSEGSIGIPGASIRMRSVLPLVIDGAGGGQVSFLSGTINAQGIVDFPAAKIQRAGFAVANYVVLVIQEPSQPEPFLRNADGSWVSDVRITGASPSDENARAVALASISINQLGALTQNGIASFGISRMTR